MGINSSSSKNGINNIKKDREIDKYTQFYNELILFSKNLINNNPLYTEDKLHNTKEGRLNDCEDNLSILVEDPFLESYITNLKSKLETKPDTNNNLSNSNVTDSVVDNKVNLIKDIDLSNYNFGYNLGFYSESKASNMISKSIEASINKLTSINNKDKFIIRNKGNELRRFYCEKLFDYYENLNKLLSDIKLIYNIIDKRPIQKLFYERCLNTGSITPNFLFKIEKSYNKDSKKGISLSKNLFRKLKNEYINDSNNSNETKREELIIYFNNITKTLNIFDDSLCVTKLSKESALNALTLKNVGEEWITGYTVLVKKDIIPDVLENYDDLQNFKLIKNTDTEKDENKVIEEQINKSFKKVDNIRNLLQNKKCENDYNKIKDKILSKNSVWINIAKQLILNYFNLLKKLIDLIKKYIIKYDETSFIKIEQKWISNDDFKTIIETISNDILFLNIDKLGITDFNQSLSLDEINNLFTINNDKFGLYALEFIYSKFILNREFTPKSIQDAYYNTIPKACNGINIDKINFTFNNLSEILNKYYKQIISYNYSKLKKLKNISFDGIIELNRMIKSKKFWTFLLTTDNETKNRILQPFIMNLSVNNIILDIFTIIFDYKFDKFTDDAIVTFTLEDDLKNLVFNVISSLLYNNDNLINFKNDDSILNKPSEEQKNKYKEEKKLKTSDYFNYILFSNNDNLVNDIQNSKSKDQKYTIIDKYINYSDELKNKYNGLIINLFKSFNDYFMNINNINYNNKTIIISTYIFKVYLYMVVFTLFSSFIILNKGNKLTGGNNSNNKDSDDNKSENKQDAETEEKAEEAEKSINNEKIYEPSNIQINELISKIINRLSDINFKDINLQDDDKLNTELKNILGFKNNENKADENNDNENNDNENNDNENKADENNDNENNDNENNDNENIPPPPPPED
jgi:hypothetical protein